MLRRLLVAFIEKAEVLARREARFCKSYWIRLEKILTAFKVKRASIKGLLSLLNHYKYYSYVLNMVVNVNPFK